MQFLYVEDNPSEAQVVEAMLHSEGHLCHTTHSGQQAVALAKRNDYDLIILDIMLPDIDGYEVIEQMRTPSHINGQKPASFAPSSMSLADSKSPVAYASCTRAMTVLSENA